MNHAIFRLHIGSQKKTRSIAYPFAGEPRSGPHPQGVLPVLCPKDHLSFHLPFALQGDNNLAGKYLPRQCHSNRDVYQTKSPEFQGGDGTNFINTRKICLIFESVIPTGDSASKSLLSVDTQRPFSVDLAKLPIQNSKEFEVGNCNNYYIPKITSIS